MQNAWEEVTRVARSEQLTFTVTRNLYESGSVYTRAKHVNRIL